MNAKLCRLRAWFVLCGLALLCAPQARAADLARRTVELEWQGQRIEGTPLAANATGIELLGRDGRLWIFPAQAAREAKQVSSSFSGYPATVMKGRLQAELGKGFRVVSTGHYLVALPEGVRSDWADRFEDLYRSFALYFAVRGFQLRDPEFPLIAIVWPNQASFQRAAHADGATVSSSVLGYYSPKTNRIMLFDIGGGQGNANAWSQNGATIIHEATHQTAFNTGLHQRFAETPRWLVEGLGMMFEAPGVWNSRSHVRREDRINRDRLAAFQKRLAAGHTPEMLAELVGSDRWFSSDPMTAYADAWALSFFLVETQPRKYCEYLALTAGRSAGARGGSAQRTADFASVFGSDLRMLNARFLRFYAELR